MRPPLIRDDLIAIRDRNRGDQNVAALLWEIKRMRALLRSHDYFRQTPTSSVGRMMPDQLRGELDEKPVVKEQPKLQSARLPKTSRKAAIAP